MATLCFGNAHGAHLFVVPKVPRVVVVVVVHLDMYTCTTYNTTVVYCSTVINHVCVDVDTKKMKFIFLTAVPGNHKMNLHL